MMDADNILKSFVPYVAAGIIFYLGYKWGTCRMAIAYGEVMSAEAILYLAAMDSDD